MQPLRLVGACVSAALLAGSLIGITPATAASPASSAPGQHASIDLRSEQKPSKKPGKKPSKKPAKKPSKKPAKKPSKKPGKRPSKKPTKRPAVLSAKAPKPVKGRVCPVREFTFGDGFGADRGRRTHQGVDMSAPRGRAIFAVETGRIDRTKRQSNKALQIVLRGKSGAKYYYGHMDRVFIRGGQWVKRGQVIGTMGDTGSPGQVHLHFEYWKSGGESDAIDPEPFIRRICRR